MKNKIIFTILMILLFNTSAYAIQMIISYEDKEQPPYYMGDSNKILNDNPGVAVEIIQKVGNVIEGLEIKLKRTPWSRCIAELSSNRIDGIFNASYKEERLKIGQYPTTNGHLQGPVDISRRITKISYSFYILKENIIEWDGIKESPTDKIIGAPLGYSIVDDLKKKGLNIEEAPSTAMNLRKLNRKRVFTAALQDVTADSIVKSNPVEFANIIKIAPPIITKPYYLMLSHNFVSEHPDMAQKIWDTIKYIRENEIDKILMKYSGI
jgi:polar amino acid transport system substrate-binding protein